jgi:hypothetical protein
MRYPSAFLLAGAVAIATPAAAKNLVVHAGESIRLQVSGGSAVVEVRGVQTEQGSLAR